MTSEPAQPSENSPPAARSSGSRLNTSSDIATPRPVSRQQPRRAKRRKPLIRIEPEPPASSPVSLPEKIVREVKDGSAGYLSSFGLHLTLLLMLWLLLMPGGYRFSGGEDGLSVNLSFGTLTKPESVPGNNLPVALPPKKAQRKPIFSSPISQKPPKKKGSQPGTKKAATAGPKKIPVRPVAVNRLFLNRAKDRREQILEKVDPEEKIRRAISAGLSWLHRQQKPAGNWKLHDPSYPDSGYRYLNTDTGATALALLAFLGDGHTHQHPGPYQKTVVKGLQWLHGVQKPNGDYHDSNELGRQTAFYAHAQATIAVCEAYALTRDERLRASAEKAVQYLIRSQNPVKGGWKYQPQEPTSRGDLSVTGWCLMALHSARAAGLDVPPDAFLLAGRFLDSVQEQNGALYKYEPAPSPRPPTPTMTAEGLLCRQYLGWPRNYAPLQEGFAYLRRPEFKPRWIAAGKEVPVVYYWYYAGHVFHNMGGEEWKQWYNHVSQLIISRQSRTPGRKRDVLGSWAPKPNRGEAYYGYGYYGGRLYMTAMCVMVLELPYRHRSVYADADIRLESDGSPDGKKPNNPVQRTGER